MTLPEGRQPITAADMAKMHPSTWSEECKALRARVAKLEAALRDVIGMLDDPTGNEHVRDMRGATVIARAALQEGKQ